MDMQRPQRPPHPLMPGPGADVAGVSPVSVQMLAAASPVLVQMSAGVSPVPVQMWQG